MCEQQDLLIYSVVSSILSDRLAAQAFRLKSFTSILSIFLKLFFSSLPIAREWCTSPTMAWFSRAFFVFVLEKTPQDVTVLQEGFISDAL